MTWIPWLLILYNFGANLANDIYLPSLPELTNVFSTSSNILQLTMTVWFAGVAAPQLFFGPLTDFFGRRPILFAGGFCFLIATLFCAAATNVWVLIIARFFQGVGVCSLNVASFSILSDLYDHKTRTRIMNRLSLFGTLAPLIGPVIGGYILAYVGWRSNFIVIFLIGLVSLLGLFYKLPESNLYLNRNALKPKNMFRNYLLLIKNKQFLKHLIPYCLILGGLVAYLTSAPFIIITNLGVPPQWFGYTQMPIFIAYLFGSLYLNSIDDEESIKKLLVRGIQLIFLSGILLVGLNYFFASHILLFILPMVVFALGFSFCASPLTSEVMSCSPTGKGSAAAILGLGMSVSCMLSSLLIGIIFDGTILSISILLCLITTIATLIYFIEPQSIVQYEQDKS